VDIRTDADGGEVGYCQFDDETECEEWSFFRGECRQGEFSFSTQKANPASEHRVEQGGRLEIREHADGGQCSATLCRVGHLVLRLLARPGKEK
jgi:putative hemolysin